MILSVSRRTDVPAFYSTWFANRLDAGFVLIPNPRNANRLGRVDLTPKNIDCIVFWTKNPRPMFHNLDRIEAFGAPFYFLFTLTPYDHRIEKGLPLIQDVLETFWDLSRRIGPERIVWRYDPILLTEEFSETYHLDHFARLCRELHGATRRCVFSFFSGYAHLVRKYPEIDETARRSLAPKLAAIASEYGFTLSCCAEKLDLTSYGITPSSCIDREMVESILGVPILAKPDKGQRAECRCIESVDIGVYDSCLNRCDYCYATTNFLRAERNHSAHAPDSPILIGRPRGDELITDRTGPSLKRGADQESQSGQRFFAW